MGGLASLAGISLRETLASVPAVQRSVRGLDCATDLGDVDESAAFLTCLCAPDFGVFWCMAFVSWEGYHEPPESLRAGVQLQIDRAIRVSISWHFNFSCHAKSHKSLQSTGKPFMARPLCVGIDEKWCD